MRTLALDSDGLLIAVTNTLGGSGTDAVTRLRLSRDWSEAGVADQKPWAEAATTAAVRGRDVWAVSGDLDILLSGGTSDEFTLTVAGQVASAVGGDHERIHRP